MSCDLRVHCCISHLPDPTATMGPPPLQGSIRFEVPIPPVNTILGAGTVSSRDPDRHVVFVRERGRRLLVCPGAMPLGCT